MKPVLRWLGLVVAALLALQLYFVVRIAAMTLVDPQSTAFERSQVWRQWHDKGSWRWRQQWVAYPQIADNLKRAVIAAEDDSFIYHDGVDWDALEKAWQRNAKAEAQAAKQQAAQAAKAPQKKAAAQHYFRKPASRLSAYEAARLAVMLPRPKYFEKLPNSSYIAGRANVIVNRLNNAELP